MAKAYPAIPIIVALASTLATPSVAGCSYGQILRVSMGKCVSWHSQLARGYLHPRLPAAAQKDYYVEIKPEQLQPSIVDSRTPAEIEEQSEHDAAIAAHRHELDQALSNLGLQKAEEMPIRVGDQSR
jgi:hypothetical protein